MLPLPPNQSCFTLCCQRLEQPRLSPGCAKGCGTQTGLEVVQSCLLPLRKLNSHCSCALPAKEVAPHVAASYFILQADLSASQPLGTSHGGFSSWFHHQHPCKGSSAAHWSPWRALLPLLGDSFTYQNNFQHSWKRLKHGIGSKDLLDGDIYKEPAWEAPGSVSSTAMGDGEAFPHDQDTMLHVRSWDRNQNPHWN